MAGGGGEGQGAVQAVTFQAPPTQVHPAQVVRVGGWALSSKGCLSPTHSCVSWTLLENETLHRPTSGAAWEGPFEAPVSCRFSQSPG